MPSQLEEFTRFGVLTRASPLPGDYCKHNLQEEFLVEERIKTLVKFIARDVKWHHDQGHCISPFDHRNIEINVHGHARIIGVGPIEKNEINIKKNYLDLHDVVRNTVFRNYSFQQQVPAEWRMLLLLMKRECIGKEYLICNNVSMMPLQIRMMFFYLGYEHVTFSLSRTDPDKQDRILKRLPFLKTWPDMLKGNILLEESFAHKTHDLKTGQGFFTYYRDTNKHRMDRCHLISEVGRYTGKEFEKILQVRYGMYLALFQEALHDEEELEGLEPHAIF
ncbi:unnamed protein product [Alopecurus aequalis]